MATTARKIIKKALSKIGALVKNEEPAADEANDGLDSLNAMITSWSNDAANINARTWETFSLVSGQSTYTIGTGGNFNTIRPIEIIDCYIKDNQIDYGMSILPDEAYDAISFKAIQGIPEFLNTDNGYPLGKIRLYPVPSSNYGLFLLTEKQLLEFATLDTELSLPPGYERALIYNLAMELAPEYGQKPDASIVSIANESLGLVRTATIRARTMDAYPLNLAVRNIFTGWRY